MSIASVMLANHLIFCCPLLLLPSIFPSIGVFSNESTLGIIWPKYWSFSFSISSSNEHSGLISFRIIWFDLFSVQGTLRSLLQHRSSLASLLADDHVSWPLLTLSSLVHFMSLLGVRPALLSRTNHSGFPAGDSGSRGPHRRLDRGDRVHLSQEHKCRRTGWPSLCSQHLHADRS